MLAKSDGAARDTPRCSDIISLAWLRHRAKRKEGDVGWVTSWYCTVFHTREAYATFRARSERHHTLIGDAHVHLEITAVGQQRERKRAKGFGEDARDAPAAAAVLRQGICPGVAWQDTKTDWQRVAQHYGAYTTEQLPRRTKDRLESRWGRQKDGDDGEGGRVARKGE